MTPTAIQPPPADEVHRSSQPVAQDHPIVLFDGVCNFCNATVNFVIDRDPQATLRFAPLQSEISRVLLKRQHLPEDYTGSLVLIEGGRAYLASDGAIRIARYLSMPWKVLSIFRVVPRFLRDPAYRFIANRRYRWFGKTESCRVPSPEYRSRFLG